MTEKRFILSYFDYLYITDGSNHQDYATGYEQDMIKFVDVLNSLAEENEMLKDIINECFNVITESDFARNEYCNALIRLLGEENDVDKAKQRIKEFLK